MESDALSFDVVIVGAGPAGLSAAIRLLQFNKDISVAVLEKGTQIGAHNLSGAILDPSALQKLIPDWASETDCPVKQKVTADSVNIFNKKSFFAVPFIPAAFRNENNYFVSIAQLCRWLGQHAEKLGAEIICGYAAVETLLESGRVVGIQTRAKGIDKEGNHKSSFEAPLKIFAKQVLLAEGSFGYLTEKLKKQFSLSKSQTYATAVKELWEIPKGLVSAGEAQINMGWPLKSNQFGGVFIYGLSETQISLGLVVGLDHWQPDFDPHEALEKFKRHPRVHEIFSKGKRLEYGAKTIPEGGWSAIDTLGVHGALLLGDSAGLVNVGTNKGIHLGMESGIIAADQLTVAIHADRLAKDLSILYTQTIKSSSVGKELYLFRNFRQGFGAGLWLGLLKSGLQMTLGGWWFQKHSHKEDWQTMNFKERPIIPLVSQEKLLALYQSGTKHEENQPGHIIIHNPDICETECLEKYGQPCIRFCPAEVFESHDKSIVLNPANCLHCKTCEIVDPFQIVNWVPPEGGGGPNYRQM